MRPPRVRESQSNDGPSTDSSGSLEQLEDHLAASTSRLALQDANNQRSATLRPRNRRPEEGQEKRRPVEGQENRPPQTRQNSGGSQETGAAAAAAAPAPATASRRQRKQRGPVSRVNQMDREIRRLRARTVPIIPKLPFSRLVRELLMKACTDQGPDTIGRITEGALQVLQESTELYLTQRFEDAYLLTHHRGRVTLEVRDMVLMGYLIDISHHRS